MERGRSVFDSVYTLHSRVECALLMEFVDQKSAENTHYSAKLTLVMSDTMATSNLSP